MADPEAPAPAAPKLVTITLDLSPEGVDIQVRFAQSIVRYIVARRARMRGIVREYEEYQRDEDVPLDQ